MSSRRRILGTFGLAVAAAAQPTLADIVVRDREPPERHEHAETERLRPVPIEGPVDMSGMLAGPVRITFTSAGSVRSGGRSAGTVGVTISEVGEPGEPFHLSMIELVIRTPGVRFAGTPILTSGAESTASIGADKARLTIRSPRGRRRLPNQFTMSGLALEADRGLELGTTIALEVATREPNRLARRPAVGSVGTVVDDGRSTDI